MLTLWFGNRSRYCGRTYSANSFTRSSVAAKPMVGGEYSLFKPENDRTFESVTLKTTKLLRKEKIGKIKMNKIIYFSPTNFGYNY